jgi:hypothetical protein
MDINFIANAIGVFMIGILSSMLISAIKKDKQRKNKK